MTDQKAAMTVRRLTIGGMVLGLVFAGSPSVRAESTLALPTPRSHYETFNPGLSGLPLLQTLLNGLDPQTQKTMLTFVTSTHLLNGRPATESKGQALARLKSLNWSA